MRRKRKAGPRGLVPGQVLRRKALGTETLYRVIGENARGVEVEVVSAPGLVPGFRFTIAIDDATAMEAVSTEKLAGEDEAGLCDPRTRHEGTS